MTKKELKRAKREAKRERASLSIRYGVYNVVRYVFLGFIVVSVLNVVFSFFFYTPKMYSIGRGNAELVEKYNILREKIRSLDHTLDELKHRDNAVYRSLFGADTLAVEGIYNDYPEEKYADVSGDRFAPLMVGTWKYMDRVARRLYLQSVSLDELQILAHNKEQMATAIPALLPIDIHKFRGVGPFGMRLHPLLGYYRMHKGIDLAGSIGDPIYAAGDGFVTYTGSGGGYGYNVVLNHGFGYQTRYAHLNKMLVTPGQWVKRGELIAEMGNTGLSQAPHLHYEVIYGGVEVNPISYFKRDMDTAEFDRIVESANDKYIYE